MTTYQRAAIHSTDDIIAIVAATGSHFFEARTMRFFNSRVLEGVYYAPANRRGENGVSTLPGNRYVFVTSEHDGNNPRLYTVRMLTLTTKRDDRADVQIDTVGEFQAHATIAQARMAAQIFASTLTKV